MKKQEKIALVIEGGGFKSVFSAGVLDAFLINKFQPFDIYIGVSSGAMCLSYYIANQYKTYFSLSKEVSVNEQFLSYRHALSEQGYMDINFFLKSCSKLLKKDGIMFVATLNKTLKSYIFAIAGAEYVLRWLPIGTHEWEKFLKPRELISILKKNNLNVDRVDGMKFNILTNEWSVSLDKSVNYIAKFIKN